MTAKDLMDLGFEAKFMSIEDTGDNPIVYFTKGSTDLVLISSEIEFPHGLNSISVLRQWVRDHRRYVELSVSIFDGLDNIPEEAVRLIAKAIDVINEGDNKK